MEQKVKKLFSKCFVRTYDYPFIIGFLEANGINGIVPSLEQNENLARLSYDMFKDWWKHNFDKKQQKEDDAERVNDCNCGIRKDENTDNVNVKYIIVRGDNHVVIDITEVLDDFLQYNIKQAERAFLSEDFGSFIRKHIVPDIFDL